MKVNELNFPIILMKSDVSYIGVCLRRSRFGLISKGNEKYYSSGVVYDSQGGSYELKGIERIKSAPLQLSLLHLQKMLIAEPNFKYNSDLELDEIKELVKAHIMKNRNYWKKFRSVEEFLSSVDSSMNLVELYSILR
ncbi:MAG: hypothetical protein AAF487_00150 [Bacteroidota bacterium]